jgi:hypothetical protein
MELKHAKDYCCSSIIFQFYSNTLHTDDQFIWQCVQNKIGNNKLYAFLYKLGPKSMIYVHQCPMYQHRVDQKNVKSFHDHVLFIENNLFSSCPFSAKDSRLKLKVFTL